jgi:ParB-like chromosome segregation protein Spo0J
MEDLKNNLSSLNEQTRALGLPEIAIVKPSDCMEQEKNARYFAPEVFQQLVDNIKSDGRLESIPLCYQTDKDKEAGKYHIISGHHRVSAAKQAGLEFIMIFVFCPKDRYEIIAKQL